MFNLLTDTVDNALGVLEGLATGELPTRRQVARLVSDGVEIAAIAAATGYSVDVIEKIMEEDE